MSGCRWRFSLRARMLRCWDWMLGASDAYGYPGFMLEPFFSVKARVTPTEDLLAIVAAYAPA